jgi:ATP-dependent Clp protease ATP-binding subunit ClpC
MFEQFTDRARKVMALANREAQHFNHEYIGTEHILLGMLKEGYGVGANVLRNLKVDLARIVGEVEKLAAHRPFTPGVGKLPLAPPAKKVIEHAIQEARSLNHHYVATEHLLLGLLSVQDGVAAQVLTNLGLNLDNVRAEVLSLLEPAAAPEDSAALVQRAIGHLAAAAEQAAAEGNESRAATLREQVAFLRTLLGNTPGGPEATNGSG